MEKVASKKTQTQTSYLFAALTLLLIIRLLPVFKAPLSYYGYDFGFYYYAASHATWHWHDFLQIVWGGYNSPLFLLGSLLHLPAVITLTATYFFAAILLGLCLYLLLKPFSNLSGIFAVVLLACSLFAAESYNMFFWKETLAIPFLVLGLKFLMQKKYAGFAISFICVLLLHRTTAIILTLSTTLYFAYLQLKTKNYLAILLEALIVTAVVVISYRIFNLAPIITNLLYNKNYYVRTGLFLQNQNLWLLWWPSLALSLAGLIIYLKKRQHALLVIFTVLCLAWIICQLPFYRRFLLYLDISVIYFAAYFLGQINYSRKLLKIALVIIAVFLCFRVIDFTLAKTPLISSGQVLEIKNFHAPPGFILAVSADDAPWLLAYAQNYRLGAPGLLEDPHTYQDWISFWQGQNQRQFLAYYPRPLYIYQRSWSLPRINAGSCLTPISTNFSELNYSCLEKITAN